MAGFIRIDFKWASDWFRLKTNLGLDRDETVWCGYKFRNDSENFGLVRYEFQSETFAKATALCFFTLLACLCSTFMNWMNCLGKVSDGNSFRANHTYSESFRYLYPSQCESIRTHPKNVLNLVCWKTLEN